MLLYFRPKVENVTIEEVPALMQPMLQGEEITAMLKAACNTIPGLLALIDNAGVLYDDLAELVGVRADQISQLLAGFEARY